MTGRNTIAEANIEISANVDTAKVDIVNLRTDVEALGTSAETTGVRMDAAFASAGNSIRNATKSAQRFVGALSSTVGIATGLFGVITILVAALGTLKVVFDKLSGGGDGGGGPGKIPNVADQLRDMSNAASGLNDALLKNPGFAAIEKEIRELEKSIVRSRSKFNLFFSGFLDLLAVSRKDPLSAVFKDIEENARKSLERLRKLRTDFLQEEKRDNAKKDIDDKEEADLKIRLQKRGAIFKLLAEVANTARISLIEDDEERALASIEKQKNALIAAAKAVGLERGEAPLQIALELVDAVGRAEIKKNKEVADDKTRLENERIQASADRQAAALAKALDRELTKVFEGLSGIFGSEFTTNINNLTGALKENAKAIKRSM